MPKTWDSALNVNRNSTKRSYLQATKQERHSLESEKVKKPRCCGFLSVVFYPSPNNPKAAVTKAVVRQAPKTQMR